MHSNDENKISVFEAVAYCLGIFVSPTSILKHSGSLGLSFIIWSLGAVISIIGALVYVELGTKIRKSGCDFAYLSEVRWYPLASAFLFVATTLTYPSILAIQTMAFGEYFIKGINEVFNKDLPTTGHIVPRLVGFSALLPLAFLNLFSLKKVAGRFQLVATVAKMIVILVIIGTGFYHLVIKGKTKNFHNSFEGTTKDPDDIVLALYNGLFAYNGFDILNFGCEEVENPRRTLPIAAFAGIGIAAIVYICMNLAYFSVLSVQQFKDSDTVAVDFAKETLGSFHYAVPFMIAILLLGSMNSTVFGSSRYLFAGAKRGIMPGVLRCAHPGSMSPRMAVIIEICVAICISFIGNLEQLLNYMTYAIWMQRTVVQVALLYMRFKHFPVPKDSIQNPIIVPILFLLICIALLVIPVKNDYQVGIYGVCFVIAGFIFYFIFVYPKKLPNFLTKFNEKSIIAAQIILNTMPVFDGNEDAPPESLETKSPNPKIFSVDAGTYRRHTSSCSSNNNNSIVKRKC